MPYQRKAGSHAVCCWEGKIVLHNAGSAKVLHMGPWILLEGPRERARVALPVGTAPRVASEGTPVSVGIPATEISLSRARSSRESTVGTS
jgi:hypothetical protein